MDFLRAHVACLSGRSRTLVQLIVLEGQGHNFFEGFFHSTKLVDFAIARAQAGARP